MNLKDVTLVVGVDRQHLNELRWSWQTWTKFKPEIFEMPMLVFFDPVQIQPSDATFLGNHPRLTFVPWDWQFARTQWEKMLTGWVHIPARHVTTPWYLKLDTDAIATGPCEWIRDEWFEPDSRGSAPVLIGSVCNHSKPRYIINLLDDWADNVPQLSRFARLDIPYSSSDRNITHERISSWVCFGNTDWTRDVVNWLTPDGRLPCSSQDTFLFYCAKRGQKHYVRKNMGAYRWRHVRAGKLPHLLASTVSSETGGKV